MWDGFIALDIPSKEGMTEEEFFNFCAANKHIKIERDDNGQIIMMPPCGLESDGYSVDFAAGIYNWSKLNNNGRSFGSSAGFTLPDKSVRSPDAAWLSQEKWESLSADERKKFSHVSPDFVIEVMSPSDDFAYMQNKMELWIKNGVRLAWLIDTDNKAAYIYRSNGSVSTISSFNQTLSGEDVLPGFSFNLNKLI